MTIIKEKYKKQFDKDTSTEVKGSQPNLVSESHSNKNFIEKLKQLAVDPVAQVLSSSNTQHLLRYTERVRDVTFVNRRGSSLRKRKLEKIIEEKLKHPINLVSPDQPSVGILTRGDSSKSLCSGDMVNQIPNDTISNQNMNGISSMKSLDPEATYTADADPPSHPSILPDFIGKCIEINVVPVSPRFQVEVPEWDASVDITILIAAYISDPRNSKWLGTKVWPFDQSNEEIIASTIGNGRPDTCSCESPGSTDCVRLHIEQKRQDLRSDLGPAFSIWMFDNIGEQVSKLWTTKAQCKFDSLLKKGSSSNNEDGIKQSYTFVTPGNSSTAANRLCALLALRDDKGELLLEMAPGARNRVAGEDLNLNDEIDAPRFDSRLKTLDFPPLSPIEDLTLTVDLPPQLHARVDAETSTRAVNVGLGPNDALSNKRTNEYMQESHQCLNLGKEGEIQGDMVDSPIKERTPEEIRQHRGKIPVHDSPQCRSRGPRENKGLDTTFLNTFRIQDIPRAIVKERLRLGREAGFVMLKDGVENRIPKTDRISNRAARDALMRYQHETLELVELKAEHNRAMEALRQTNLRELTKHREKYTKKKHALKKERDTVRAELRASNAMRDLARAEIKKIAEKAVKDKTTYLIARRNAEKKIIDLNVANTALRKDIDTFRAKEAKWPQQLNKCIQKAIWEFTVHSPTFRNLTTLVSAKACVHYFFKGSEQTQSILKLAMTREERKQLDPELSGSFGVDRGLEKLDCSKDPFGVIQQVLDEDLAQQCFSEEIETENGPLPDSYSRMAPLYPETLGPLFSDILEATFNSTVANPPLGVPRSVVGARERERGLKTFRDAQRSTVSSKVVGSLIKEMTLPIAPIVSSSAFPNAGTPKKRSIELGQSSQAPPLKKKK